MSHAHCALRRGRHSLAGQIYLVTFTTLRRRPHFAEWRLAADAARHLSTPSNWRQSQLLAWVLMPDHWHGLIQLGDDDDLSKRVGWIKAESARQLGKAHPTLAGVWAPAFHDRALRDEEDVIAAARYLVMNPVRAGLVLRAGGYPYWDAIWV